MKPKINKSSLVAVVAMKWPIIQRPIFFDLKKLQMCRYFLSDDFISGSVYMKIYDRKRNFSR